MPLPTSRLRHRVQLYAAVGIAVSSVVLVARIAKVRTCHRAPPAVVAAAPATPPALLPATIAAHSAPLALPPAFERALHEGDAAALDRAYTRETSLGLALQRAALYGKPTSVEWVLDHGADAHFKENDVDAPILEADAFPEVVLLLKKRGAEEPDLSVAAISGSPNAVERLLAQGANVNPTDGTTPLFDAVSSTLATVDNKARIVDLFLARGADPNQLEAGTAKSPLAAAVEDGPTALPIVKVLLARKARVTGETLSAAFDLEEAAKGPMFDALLAGNLEPGATAVALSHATGESVVHVKKVAARGVAWAWQDGESTPAAPLVDAIDRLDYPLAKALIEAGAPVDLQLKDGRCALGQAIDAYTTNGLDAERLVELLVSHGASPNKRLPDGRTPLFAAAEVGDNRIVKALLDAGARVNERVLDETALDAAERNGNTPVARILDGHGGHRAPARKIDE